MEITIKIDYFEKVGNTTTSKISIPELAMVNKDIVEEILYVVESELNNRN